MRTTFAIQRSKAAGKALDKVIRSLEKWQHLYGIDNDEKKYSAAAKSDLIRLLNQIERGDQ